MKKKLYMQAAVFSAAVFLLSGMSCSSQSAVPFSSYDGTPAKLTALNKNARSGIIDKESKSSYIYFQFPEDLSAALEKNAGSDAVSAGSGMALTVDLRFFPEAGTAPRGAYAAVGFLFADDFTGAAGKKTGGRLKKELADRPLVYGTMPDSGFFGFAGNRTPAFVFALPSAAVRGFFVYCDRSVQVAAVSVAAEQIYSGWCMTDTAFKLYYPASGGCADSIFETDAHIRLAVFPELLPESDIAVLLQENSAAFGADGVQKRLSLSCDRGGDEPVQVTARIAPGMKEIVLHPDGLDGTVTAVSVVQNAADVRGIVSRRPGATLSAAGLAPRAVDPGWITAWPRSRWRQSDFELFAWDRFPSVLFFDTADYRIQDQFFKRLAFFTEKKGYTGRLVSDREIEKEHGYNAHDYRAESLAAFFDLAEKEQFPLNQKELLLRNILLANGIIVKRSGAPGFAAGIGAVISISQESPQYLRRTFIAHEGLHGLYFIDAAFRAEVDAVYRACDARSLRFLQRYFAVTPSLNYDTDDMYLMQNEFMAYMLQQPVSAVAPYFCDRIATYRYISTHEPGLTQYIKDTKAAAFTAAAAALDSYIFERWGLAGGRVSLVTVR